MKFLFKIKYNLFVLILIGLLFSCTSDHSHEGHDHDNEHNHGEVLNAGESMDAHHDDEEEGLHLTNKQVDAIDLQFGDFSKVKISAFIKATGTLGLPPKAYASISAKEEGFIKSSRKYVEGSYVKKGALIAYLENPSLIDKQQKYVEYSAELDYLKKELERQKLLFEANASIEKVLQKLEMDVTIKNAQKMGVEQHLRYLGIDLLQVSSGVFKQKIPILAPLSGFITSINMHNGMFVKPEQQLLEIASENHLHLELDVFEKDIALVKEDQKITYIIPALGNKEYLGEVHVIGKEFDSSNKTVRIHGHLDDNRPKFIKGLFISAKIWLNDDTVDGLPEASVVRDGATSFIYVGKEISERNEVEFMAIRIIPGTISDGFISVKLLDEIPTGMKIVTNGAYYVYAQSKAGTVKHEH